MLERKGQWQKHIGFLMCAAVVVIGVVSSGRCWAGELPGWTKEIRGDHPRLFFNAETWPGVRDRALGAERSWYDSILKRVDALAKSARDRERLEVKDYGRDAAWAAFVYRVTGQKRYLDLTKKCLDASLRFYDDCYDQKRAVNWYSTSRVHATLAWDWVYNDLTESERRDYMARLVRAIDRVLKAKPPIYRENMSGYNTGFYGVKNCLWFIGCTAFGTDIEPETVNEWLVWGRNENIKMLEHRRKACGDDGGGASATLGYVFGAYPWAEQNFFYTWRSATGQNIAPDWPHGASLTNYVLWNWIESDEGPLEFGYGDTPHTTNAMPAGQLYTHMANIQHLYGRKRPDYAALSAFLQQRLARKRYTASWFIYPFLWTGDGQAFESFAPESLPLARHFETMGQIIMRSGTGAGDTYCLFSCGGMLRQHRHYDALNFVIYHKGFLALDSGTRYSQFDNGRHLANYYAQTVAHNCVVIHQPGEPPARYWGGTVTGNHGGQHKQLGSTVKAFETCDDYVYAAGDATACYRHGPVKGADLPEKCDLVTRQMVFLPPSHFVVFDRVVATDPSYKKDWLLHTAKASHIEGKMIRADHRQGRMFCTTLLPRDAVLTPVGGPGKEFWAAGQNWDLVTKGLHEENLDLIGRWRVEVSPGQTRAEDVFLHVIQVGDTGLAGVDKAELIESTDRYGAKIQIDGATWQVTFNATGPLGGHIICRGLGPAIDRPLTDAVQQQRGITIER